MSCLDLALVTVVSVFPIAAQTASITGRISDPSGATVRRAASR
jgi:hypothetical protein